MSFQSRKVLSSSSQNDYEKTINKLSALPKEGKLNIELLINLGKWLVLITALIGGAFCGVFYFYIQIDCQLLKSSWRYLGLTIALLPLVYYEYKKQKDTFLYSRENLLNLQAWKTMFLATGGHSIWTVTTLISVNYTSMAQALLFLNLHAIMIVAYNMVKKTPVSRPEVLGSLLATVGAIFPAFDGNIHSTEGMVDLSSVSLFDRIVYGDLVALFGSVGGALYFTKAAELKNEFPVYFSIFGMSAIGFLQTSIISLIFEGSTFSFDSMNGIFGLFTQEWFMTSVYMVIITGYGAYVCYIFALKYFGALLVSIVITLDPVVGGIIVYLLGWQSFPGPLTIIGFFFVLPGIVIITLAGSKRLKDSVKHSLTSKEEPFLNA